MSGLRNFSHHFSPKAVNFPATTEGDEFHVASLARLEANGRTGGNVQTHAKSAFAIEAQCRIGFSKVVVRTDLDRSVSHILHSKAYGIPPLVQGQGALDCSDFSGKHGSLLFK